MWGFAPSGLSGPIDGQTWHRLSETQACDGTSSRPSGIQREKGITGLSKKNALDQRHGFDLLFLDECEVHLHPTLTKVWTFRNVRAQVPAAGTNRKLCIYGALNYRTGQVHYLTDARKNACQFNEFLQQLLEAKRDRFVILVLDNARYHTTQKTLDLLAEHEDHLFVIWLPKYSPELNAIEGLWGYLKRSALNNYFFGTMENLEQAVVQTFTELNQNPNSTLALAYNVSQKLCRVA
jgi:transposase